MIALLRPLLRRTLASFASPARAALGVGVVAALAASYRLGTANEYRSGFEAGRTACIAAHRARDGETATRQLKDRLNAESDTRLRSADPDGLRCGPATRDCPE